MAVAACSRALPQPKFLPATRIWKFAQLGRVLFAQNLEGVLAQLLSVDVDQIPAGDDDVGVDIVAELTGAALNDGFHSFYRV